MKTQHVLEGEDGLGLVAHGSLPVRQVDDVEMDSDEISAIRRHPLGVKPSGNQYTATTNARHAIGIFQKLPDELLVAFLETLDAAALRQLGSTCRALSVFCGFEDLWKGLFLRSGPSANFRWQGSWRATYLGFKSDQTSHVMCPDLFSDVLYRPFQCANIDLSPYADNIPKHNEIPRLDDLAPEEFEKWASTPFILTKPVRKWPVYQSWDTSQLLEKYADVDFRAEAVDWPLKTYVDYMDHQADESPLYLFERRFVEKMDITVGRHEPNAAYWIPECFGEDIFAYLGPQRPDSRWLIVGPARSGSTFHKDPNATSAWNAVLRGAKYWIMFPSDAASPPPGVYTSPDQSEVTSPLSIAEWLLGFHAAARRAPGCREGICAAGEVLHVPSGWWHLVVNLDASIAITQNFVPRAHLAAALGFLRDKPDQVSGFRKEVRDPYALFVERVGAHQSDLLTQALAELDSKAAAKKRKWDDAVGDKETGGFSFGFGDDDSDADIP